MSSRREEIGIFSFDSYANYHEVETAQKITTFNAWVNERLANGGRVKSITQCAAGAERVVVTTITVVIEYA